MKLSWAFREPCSRLQERILAIPKNRTKTIVFLSFSTIETIGFQRFGLSGTRLKAFWGSLEPSWRRFGRRLGPLGQLLELSRARLERLEGPEIPGDSLQSVQGVLEAKDPGVPALGGSHLPEL